MVKIGIFTLYHIEKKYHKLYKKARVFDATSLIFLEIHSDFSFYPPGSSANFPDRASFPRKSKTG